MLPFTVQGYISNTYILLLLTIVTSPSNVTFLSIQSVSCFQCLKPEPSASEECENHCELKKLLGVSECH